MDHGGDFIPSFPRIYVIRVVTRDCDGGVIRGRYKNIKVYMLYTRGSHT